MAGASKNLYGGASRNKSALARRSITTLVVGAFSSHMEQRDERSCPRRHIIKTVTQRLRLDAMNKSFTIFELKLAQEFASVDQ